MSKIIPRVLLLMINLCLPAYGQALILDNILHISDSYRVCGKTAYSRIAFNKTVDSKIAYDYCQLK